MSCPCVHDLARATTLGSCLGRNSGTSLSFAALPLRLTEVVVYHAHGVFPPGGRGKPGAGEESCIGFFLDLWCEHGLGLGYSEGKHPTTGGSLRGREVSLIVRVDQPSKHI